jgi:hypothetical protein
VKKEKKDQGHGNHGDHGGGEDSSSATTPDERKLLVMVAWLFFANLVMLAWNVGALDFFYRQP